MPPFKGSEYLKRRRAARLGFLGVVALWSCAPGPSAPKPAEAPAPRPVVADTGPVRLPPIPRTVGPLAIRVVYPSEGQQLTARDSNFVYGSIGSGDATLTINRTPVTVQPNGSFLAFLPIPAGAKPTYDLIATRGADTSRLTLRVAAPPPRVALPETGRLTVDSGSVNPRPRMLVTRWDPVRVSIRAPSNASVELQLADGARVAMPRASAVGSPDPNLFATEITAARLNSPAWMTIARGADTVRLALPRVGLIDSAGPQLVVVGATASAASDTDRVIVARPVVGGTYKWFLLPGTVVELTGRIGEVARIRLARDLQVYVDPAELTAVPNGSLAPNRVASNARVVAANEWTDVRIPIAAVPPFSVDAEASALVLTLYGVTANTDIINYSSTDSIVSRVTWRQASNDRAEFRVELRDAPFGYLVLWDRGVLVLRVRRAPRIDASRPLAGLTIAVDPGHPPGGTTGPTGLYEAVAALAVAERVKTYLEARGAQVVMTRTAPGAIALGDRPIIARRANAHAFVSIHLNAFPDGVNPFNNNGTGAYYFNAWSEPLARAVQNGMVRRMGLRDLGINYDNLAVLRPTWMPSVLCEGAFLMLPEQESAMRTAEFQDAYARGVVEGIEQFFAQLARRQAKN